jgi:hypothetical protein
MLLKHTIVVLTIVLLRGSASYQLKVYMAVALQSLVCADADIAL